MLAMRPDHDGFASGVTTTGIRMRQMLAIVMQVAFFAVVVRMRPFENQVNVLVFLAIEAVFIGWLLLRLLRIVRTNMHQRFPGGTVVRDVVLAAFPGPFGHVVLGELTIWIGLWRLVSRRFRARQPEFTYHRRSADYGMLMVVIVTAPVELLLVELLVPWPIVRWILLLTAFYSIVWFVGLVVAPIVHPHVATNDRLILHNGATVRVAIDYSNIAALSTLSVPWPDVAGRIPPALVIHADTAWLQSGSRSSLRIDLHHPILVGDSGSIPVRSVVIAADAPEALVQSISQHQQPYAEIPDGSDFRREQG